MDNSKKILLIQLGTIGDLILATSFYEELFHKFPDHDFEIICSIQNWSILQFNPRISKIHVFDKNWIKTLKLLKELRRSRYEYYIDPKDHISSQSRVFARLIKAKTKIGFDPNNRIFDTNIQGFNKNKHFTEIVFQAGGSLGIEVPDPLPKPIIFQNPESEELIKSRLTDKPTITINISASKKLKLWNIDNWMKLVKKLPSNFQYFLSYAPSEKDEARLLLDKFSKLTDLKSRSIFDVNSIVKYSDIVLTIDTAVVHIAAAYNKPLVGLFGGIDKEFIKFSPLSDQQKVLRNPAGIDGVNEINASDVFDKFMELTKELGLTTSEDLSHQH